MDGRYAIKIFNLIWIQQNATRLSKIALWWTDKVEWTSNSTAKFLSTQIIVAKSTCVKILFHKNYQIWNSHTYSVLFVFNIGTNVSNGKITKRLSLEKISYTGKPPLLSCCIIDFQSKDHLVRKLGIYIILPLFTQRKIIRNIILY